MSKPFWEPTIRGAISEIISGMSALNMEAEPIELSEARKAEGRPFFLSETDAWAKHSMVHFHAAAAILNSVERRQNHQCYGVHCERCDEADRKWHRPDLEHHMSDIYENVS